MLNTRFNIFIITHHTELLQYLWLCSLCYTLHPCDLLCNWYFYISNIYPRWYRRKNVLLHFFFIFLFLWWKFPVLCWMKMVDIHVLYCWVWWYLLIYYTCPILHSGMFPLYSLCWVFIINGCWIMSEAFSLLRWSYDFYL